MNGQVARAALMPGSIRLGHVAGIPIALHYSWFIIAGLITLSLAAHFRTTYRDWQAALVWGVSTVTAALFFVTLLAHELSHALVARRRHLRVRSITLFALGGLARLETAASTAGTELLVAIAGPIASFAIGFTCVAIAQWMAWSPENGATGVLGAVLGWLGSINLLLAGFNLIPGYPLDGGRILKAILWAAYKDGTRATRSASRVGQAVAGVFIAWGLIRFFGGAGFGGLWLAFIGWFLLIAAQSEYAQVTISESLRGLRVADLMDEDCVTVSASTDLRSLVDDLLLRTGRRCVMVQGDGRVLGLVTPKEVRGVDRSRWGEVTVRDVMRPIDTVRTVAPETPAMEAFTTMAREDVNQLPVVAEGRLKGLVSRAHILRLLQARSELNA